MQVQLCCDWVQGQENVAWPSCGKCAGEEGEQTSAATGLLLGSEIITQKFDLIDGALELLLHVGLLGERGDDVPVKGLSAFRSLKDDFHDYFKWMGLVYKRVLLELFY